MALRSAPVVLKEFFGLHQDQTAAGFVKESNDLKKSDPDGYRVLAQDCADALGHTLKS